MPEKVDGIATNGAGGYKEILFNSLKCPKKWTGLRLFHPLGVQVGVVKDLVEMPEKVDGIATVFQGLFRGEELQRVEMPEKVDGIATIF